MGAPKATEASSLLENQIPPSGQHLDKEIEESVSNANGEGDVIALHGITAS